MFVPQFRSLSWVVLVLALAVASDAAMPERPVFLTPPKSDYVPDPASVTREGPGYRYTHSGWIVAHIEGEPYERGYQHGKLLAAEIVDNIQTSATLRSAKAPSDGWRHMRTLVNALFLRRYEQEYLHEMKGIADGAAAAGAKFDSRPVDLLDIVALNSSIEVDFLDSSLDATATGLEGIKFRDPPEGQTQAEDDDHCSAFAATAPATADGQIVFGHITMFHLYAVRHFNVWLDIQPKAGHRLVFQTYPGGIMSGLDYYMNDAGLLCCETTIAQTSFHAQGEPLASRIRRVVQYADSIDKAVEILLSGNNGLYSNDWLLGDIKTAEVASFELGTHKHKLSRSSKREFPGGTEGFYWGCNNMKDLEVRKETVPSLGSKPANLVFHPHSRDVAWQQLFEKHRGKIDASFGFESFTTPPVAAFRSCDAKFTTTALAKELKSWALFGPPLGRTWDAAPEEARRLADIKPLVSNDWALLHVNRPQEAYAAPPSQSQVVDLVPFPKSEKKPEPSSLRQRPTVLPPAWHGTLLPSNDGDIWLAAAFSDFERLVSLEKSLKAKNKEGKLSKDDEDKLAVARFAPESRWLAAARRAGHDVPLAEITREWTSQDWYHIASGKGVQLLAILRGQIGPATFDKAMDEFGREHAGQAVTSAQFREHLEKAAGKSLAAIFDPWLNGKGNPELPQANFWSIDSFETEPQRALIVYGTLADRAAQREAADLLARKIARRGSNATVVIKADSDVTDEDLKGHHVLLVGRPTTNSVTARLAEGLSIRFGQDSFVVRGETYAHAHSAVVAAGSNRLNPRYSVVVYAGLGARATRQCVENFPSRSGEAAEVLLMPAGRSAKSLRIVASAQPQSVAMP